VKKTLLPIETVASKLDLTEDLYEKRSPVSAKLSLDLLKDARFRRGGKLVLVTATTPTVFGEGKTVTSIGLVQGLEKIGKRAVLTSREPSLGPVFGMKGGAAGGGRSQVEPAEKINLHFHGDFHAITSAHNLLAALIDSHMFHGNDLDLDPDGITWPRTLDMNDRALRRITVNVMGTDKKQRDGNNRPSGFLITAASEIMAILALARPRGPARPVGADRDRAGPQGQSSARNRPERDRADDGAVARSVAAEPGADYRRHARNGALRTVRKHRARHQLRRLTENGAADGGLRGQRDWLRIGPGV
jgi:hypothetical protein